MVGTGILDAPSGRAMTLAEWAAMSEDEPGELVDGLLVDEEDAHVPHEAVLAWTLLALGTWAKPRKAVVLGSNTKFALSPRLGRKPDISVFFTLRQKLPRRGPTTAPPDLIVEVVSPTARDGRRDRVEKLREYAAFGVRWYWLLDLHLRTLQILKLGEDGRYTFCVSATDGAVAVPECEGLTLDLDALWQYVDEIVEPESDPDPC